MSNLDAQISLYNATNELYHNHGEPLITDQKFDILKQQLVAAGYTPAINQVGASVTKTTTYRHRTPMLSLSNVFTYVGLQGFLKMLPACIVFLEDKLDGLACSLIYEQGQLIRALTRGDGIMGEDITSHVKLLDTVPNTLPTTLDLEVRGEIVIDQISFEQLNTELVALGKPPMKSARNTAVGAIKAKDPKTAKDRGCKFIAYSWVGLDTDSDMVGMHQLTVLGFTIVHMSELYAYDNVEGIMEYAQERLRSDLDIQIDGVVIKVESIQRREMVGMNNTSPRWAVAYKENTEIADTTLEAISWQVGRTGAITPVGHLSPITLSGATIDRVTLHNFDEILRLDIAVGDVVRVVRSGQVIPKITEVITRPADRVIIPRPLVCPTCKRSVAVSETNVVIRCNHTLPTEDASMCPDAAIAKLIYACSKEAVELKGVGDEIIIDLYRLGLVWDVWDLFDDQFPHSLVARHPATAVERLPHYQNLVTNARHTDLYRAIKILNIPLIADINARAIAAHIKCLGDLLTHSANDLGLKGVRAELFTAYITHPYIRRVITELDQRLTYRKVELPDQQLCGKNYVVTGSFDDVMTRKQLEAYITRHGGKIQSSVSAKTSLLIAGDNAGSKLQQATKLGIPISNRDDFLQATQLLGCK